MTTEELIDSYQKLLDDGYNPNTLRVSKELFLQLIEANLREITDTEDIVKVSNYIIAILKERETKE